MASFDSQLVGTIAGFLTEIGINVRSAEIDEPTFLPGVTIEKGKLVVSESKLAFPGDLLHEAGHIAVTSPDDRANLDGTITLPDSEGGGYEMAAIAWSYAAALHLGIDLSILFHENGYKGGSHALIDNFSTGRYIGVPVLQWVGMTLDEQSAKESGIEPYPHMLKWIR